MPKPISLWHYNKVCCFLITELVTKIYEDWVNEESEYLNQKQMNVLEVLMSPFQIRQSLRIRVKGYLEKRRKTVRDLSGISLLFNKCYTAKEPGKDPKGFYFEVFGFVKCFFHEMNYPN